MNWRSIILSKSNLFPDEALRRSLFHHRHQQRCICSSIKAINSDTSKAVKVSGIASRYIHNDLHDYPKVKDISFEKIRLLEKSVASKTDGDNGAAAREAKRFF